MDAFEKRGTWWLPEKPDSPFFGILKFDPIKGTVLEIIGQDLHTLQFDTHGTQVGSLTFLSHAADTVPIILGYAGGYPTTLVGCHRTRSLGEWSVGYVGSSYAVQRIFSGCHFESPDQIVFSDVSVHFKHLEAWVVSNGYQELEWCRSTETGIPLGFRIHYSLPESQELECGDWNVSIERRLWVNPYDLPRFEAEERTLLKFTPRDPQPYRIFRETPLYLVGQLLSLAIGRPAIVDMEYGHSPHCLEERTGNVPKPSHIAIYRVVPGADVPAGESTFYDMLFTYADVSDSFGRNLTLWFDKYERLREPLGLYASLIYRPSVGMEWTFLTLAQALESYHRNVHGGEFLSKQDYKPIFKKLVEAIPSELTEEHHRAITDSLQHGYQINFRARLRRIITQILDAYKEEVSLLVGDRDNFIDQVVTTRNYYTHRTDELRPRAVTEPQSLRRLSFQMLHILQLCFLVEIDAPTIAVKKRLRKNRSFREYAEYLED